MYIILHNFLKCNIRCPPTPNPALPKKGEREKEKGFDNNNYVQNENLNHMQIVICDDPLFVLPDKPFLWKMMQNKKLRSNRKNSAKMYLKAGKHNSIQTCYSFSI